LPQPPELDQPAVSLHHILSDPQVAALCTEGDSQIRQLVAEQSARVFIISGPSGVGKDSVIEKLRDVYPSAQYVVTATSRPMRDGEIDGVHYLFLERDDFERQIEAGEFIEHALVYGNLYGVPKRPIVEGLANGQQVIIKVDVKGAATLRERITNTASIFLLPESMDALADRLQARKTETYDVLMKRFRTACEELARVGEFDYAVFNEAGRLDDALGNIVAIIEAERRRVHQPDITIV
jgi:guanylate kinase